MNRILQISPLPERAVRLAWTGIVAAVLTACGIGPPIGEADTSDRFAFVTTIDIDSATTRAELETEFGGGVIVFRPEAGFAVLGLDARPPEGFGAQAYGRHHSTELETSQNLDQIAAPEAFAAGFSSWSGGFSSWSGGFSSWSGGFSSWSGGFSSWSGGSPEPTTFIENVPVWEQIGLPEAERLAPKLGAGVKIAIIDTGIDVDHPAFSGRLAARDEWRDFIDHDGLPMDESGGRSSGHGTAVAGIVIQIAPGATILPIRVLGSDGFGDVDDVVAAIDHAISMDADVVNLSLGTDVDVPALEAIIAYAESRQVVVVASAGNSGEAKITYPAAYATQLNDAEFIVGVGSVDRTEVKSIFSNYGDTLAMVAPGEFIVTLAPDSQIAYWSGTSMAAPMVAGAAALGLAEKTAAWQLTYLPDYLVYHSENIGRFNRDYRFQLGAGRLDVYGFLKAMGLY